MADRKGASGKVDTIFKQAIHTLTCRQPYHLEVIRLDRWLGEKLIEVAVQWRLVGYGEQA